MMQPSTSGHTVLIDHGRLLALQIADRRNSARNGACQPPTYQSSESIGFSA